MNAPFSATGAFASNPSVNTQHTTVTPYTEAYNLTLEHELGRGLAVRVGYVGQNNVKQNNSSGTGNTAPDINLPTPAAGPVHRGDSFSPGPRSACSMIQSSTLR